MTSSPASSIEPTEEGKVESFADATAAGEALAKASEALDELRGLAAQVDAEGLNPGTIEKASDKIASDIDPKDARIAAATSSEQQHTVLLSEVLQQKQEEIKTISAAKPKVGETLRAARAASGYALEDIAAEIKIKAQHLSAIEEGRFGDLPSRTYAVGFVRAYAKALNLDAEALVSDCRREVTASLPQKQHYMAVPEAVDEQPLPSMSLVVMTAAFAFFLSAVGYVFTKNTVETPAPQPPSIAQVNELKNNSVPAPQAQVPAPVQQAAPAPALTPEQLQQQQAQQQAVVQPVPHEEPANVDTAAVDTTHVSSGFLQKGLVAQGGVAGKAAAPSRIKLKATDETTVQIFDASGRMIAERVINKGEAFYVPDKLGLTLATSNAGALKMQIDGKDMPALGDPDEAMHNVPLNPDSLLKYLQ